LTDGVDHNGDGVVNDLDIYKDVAGGGPNGNEPDGQITQEDRVIDGSPQPDWILGHTSNLTYQDFDLSFTLRAHIGNDVYNNTASFRGALDRLKGQTPNNLHESYLTTRFDSPQFFSDFYVEDASFLRVQNVTLGYTVRSLPQVDRLRIYGSVQNAFTFTGYSGPDPEVPDGLDSNLYPRSRTFTAGINLQL
jgi:iron complex outermembrane receptor protein